MLPVVEELYDKKEDQARSMKTYTAFFNTEPQLGTVIVGLFASSALSLNFIVNQKYKLAGSMNIINLCLVVATAYQFDQVKNIVWLFGIAAGVVLVYFVVRFLLKKKKKEKQQSIENKVVDVDVVDKEN